MLFQRISAAAGYPPSLISQNFTREGAPVSRNQGRGDNDRPLPVFRFCLRKKLAISPKVWMYIVLQIDTRRKTYEES